MMICRSLFHIALAGALLHAPVHAVDQPSRARPSMAEVLKASVPGDWRPLDPDNTLYLELAAGRVVIELAPAFAPRHVANIKTLVREGYFDGLAILRAQDNYVVQWGDPDEKRSFGTAASTLPQEFATRIRKDLPFARLADPDTYAPQTGFSNGLPSARDPKSGQAWLTHCYGMVGAARGNDADSGSGASLYVVVGHAPRQLDRNVTLVGRVMQGMELLSTLPRGGGALGFHEKPEQYVPIRSVRIAADLPEVQRADLEILRTDTPTFGAVVDAARNRGGDWYKTPVGHVELCNVPVAVRSRK